jgi:4-carboxymuconolactone decarboxylase
MAELGVHGSRSAEQEAHYAQLQEQRGRLDGLYGTLTLHRGLAEMMLEIGRFYRTAATVPDRYREAATLAVANETRCAYVWSKHEPTARTAGIPQAAIEALRGGRYDDAALADEERDAVAAALAALALRSVPVELQERVIERWGVEGLLELSVLAGVYRMIAGYLASIDVPLPPDGADPWGPDPGPGLGGA